MLESKSSVVPSSYKVNEIQMQDLNINTKLHSFNYR